MITIELDNETELALIKLAKQQGKSSEQWLKDRITQFIETQNKFAKQRPTGLSRDRGVPVPDSFFEPLPIEQSKSPLKISDLVGQVPRCFNSAAEIDAFIRAERDAWED